MRQFPHFLFSLAHLCHCCSCCSATHISVALDQLRTFSSYFLRSHRQRKMGKKKGGSAAGSATAIVASKKKGAATAGTSGATAARKKKGAGTRFTNGSWRPSIVKPSKLFTRCQDGALPAAEDDSRLPSDEVIASPPTGF